MGGFATFSQLGRYGRFANQIYQIAGTIGIARKNGLDPVFPVWRNYDHAERFGSSEDINVFEHFKNLLPPRPHQFENRFAYLEPTEKHIGWGYHDVILPPGSWDIQGHLQSPKYFQHCIAEVRHYMTMKADFDGYHNVICLHARRGDYDNKYHPVTPLAYYAMALMRMPGNTPIAVFSDDQEFYAQLYSHLMHNGQSKYASWLVSMNGTNYLDAFSIMKRCSHFVICNSSYSAAAATLSDAPGRIVVAPTRWFGPAYTNISGKDIYEKNWILI